MGRIPWRTAFFVLGGAGFAGTGVRTLGRTVGLAWASYVWDRKGPGREYGIYWQKSCLERSRLPGRGDRRLAQLESDVLRPLLFGEVVDVCVTGIAGYGAFVVTEEGHRGLIHLSELADEWVPFGQVEDYVTEGEHLRAKVVKANPEAYGFSARGLNHVVRTRGTVEAGTGPGRQVSSPPPRTRAASTAVSTDMEMWMRYLREVTSHMFTTPAAQERLRQLADEAGGFALGVAMGNRITTAALESVISRDLRAALGLRQVEATDHAIDRWTEKVDPGCTREEARQAIARAARAGTEVREATALVQSGDVILAVTDRGAVATVYRREEELSPTLPEDHLRVNGLPLGAIARVRAANCLTQGEAS